MKTPHALAFLVPLAGLSLAAPQALAQGTAAQRSACMPDVFRLCASAVPNVGNIKACLAREHDRLSPACRTVMDEAGATTRQAEAAPPPRRPTERLAERRAPTPAGHVARSRSTARVAGGTAPACACSPRIAARSTRYAAVAQRHRATARRPRGYGSEMEQAMYWMRTLSGLSGSMGGSLGGFSLGSLAGLMP